PRRRRAPVRRAVGKTAVKPPGAPAFPRGHAAASVVWRRGVAAAAQRAAEIRHRIIADSSGLPPFSVPSGNDRRAGLTVRLQSGCEGLRVTPDEGRSRERWYPPSF